jgi:hypothetical protein
MLTDTFKVDLSNIYFGTNDTKGDSTGYTPSFTWHIASKDANGNWEYDEDNPIQGPLTAAEGGDTLALDPLYLDCIARVTVTASPLEGAVYGEKLVELPLGNQSGIDLSIDAPSNLYEHIAINGQDEWYQGKNDAGSLTECLNWINGTAQNNKMDGTSVSGLAGRIFRIALEDDQSIGPLTLGAGTYASIQGGQGSPVSIIIRGNPNGHTLDWSDRVEINPTTTGSLITIAADSYISLTLEGELTLQGKSNNTAALVSVGSKSLLTMNTDVIIKGNHNYSTTGGRICGGVYLASDAAFTMNGGTISNNTVDGHGAGVYMEQGSSFTMNRGQISNNVSMTNYPACGGGVYVGANSTFTMKGGTISGNEASSGGGAGVYVASGGTFTQGPGATVTDDVVEE